MNNFFQKTEPNTIYRAFFILVAVFACLSYFHELIKVMVFAELGDFSNYYFYSKAIWSHYNVYTIGGPGPLLEQLKASFGMPCLAYPAGQSPAFFFLMKPLTLFDCRSAFRIWTMLNNLLLFCSIMIVFKLVRKDKPAASISFIENSSLFMVLSFFPLIENMYCGQTNILILFSFAAALYLLSKERYILSGIMLSLGILIKPFFGIVLLFFLWKRCYRVFFTALITLVASELLPILLYGKEVIFSYWTIGAKDAFFCNINAVSMANLSLGALANRAGNSEARLYLADILLAAAYVFSVILSLYAFYATRRKFKSFDPTFALEFSLFLALILIIFPVVHGHHYVILYLPLVLVWAELNRDPKPASLILFIVSFLLIGLKYSLDRFTLFHSGFLSILSGLKLYGVIILFFLAAHLIAKNPERVK